MKTVEPQLGPVCEQARARYPDRTGYVQRDGVRVFWELCGDGEETILFLPTWSIIHSRTWKAQIPYFARHCRVLTFDPRGNGRSDRPDEPDAYREQEFAADALAVMDAAGAQRAVLVSLSRGAERSLLLAAEHPERVASMVFVGPAVPLGRAAPRATAEEAFVERRDAYRGWEMFNSHYWLEHYEAFVEFFFAQVFNEPHSTKQREDAVAWALETNAQAIISSQLAPRLSEAGMLELVDRVHCRALVIHGSADAVRPHDSGAALAKVLDAELVSLQDSGHGPHARIPAKVNPLIRDFALRGDTSPRDASSPHLDPTINRPNGRPRALFVCSPIGLGHAQRDVAIARELRALRPDLQIDWLAQDPVTRVLEAEGETIHPQSVHLASESAHIEAESSGHDLHCFQAYRRMDEILIANFMLFHDVVSEQHYDLWIGDEAWELDHYLHEHPELKRAPFAWLTDFVGFLPMPDGGEREAFLTADYNAEMVEHVAAHPHVRDCSIFIGDPEDIVEERLGPDLPMIRDWTEQHFDFASYISEFDPDRLGERDALRAELGYGPEERVCIATVGGSGVGGALLRRVIDAYPRAKRLVPELRMIVVAGPRIDPDSLPFLDGLEVHAYVHNLYRHLTACDLAITQGGLGTTMELTASRRPFIYFPLEHHFEQQFHVHHRLERYSAGHRMDFAQTDAEELARTIAQELGREVGYRPVRTDGPRRAAARIAELL